MPRATYFTARLDDLEFTLCHRTPHWEFTVQNHTDATLWINRRIPLPAGGTYTICRRTRTPAFGLQINWLTLEVDAMRVTVTKDGVASTSDFIEVPSRSWRARSPVLPLEVSVYGTARGASTAVQYRNTSATDTLTLNGDLLLPPGETRTFTGKPWKPLTSLHSIYVGTTYYCVTNVDRAGVYLAASAPAPAPAPEPHFDAPSFYAHVLQQLRYRDPALLTDILRTQGFTSGQIAAFEDSLAEL
jgi:hypothetical protein